MRDFNYSREDNTSGAGDMEDQSNSKTLQERFRLEIGPCISTQTSSRLGAGIHEAWPNACGPLASRKTVPSTTETSVLSAATSSRTEMMTSLLSAATSSRPERMTSLLSAATSSRPESMTSVLSAATSSRPERMTSVLSAATSSRPERMTSLLSAATSSRPERITSLLSAATSSRPERMTSVSAATSSRPEIKKSASWDVWNAQHTLRNTGVHDGGDDWSMQYKRYYTQHDVGRGDQSYLNNEQEFPPLGFSEDKKTYTPPGIFRPRLEQEIKDLTQIEDLTQTVGAKHEDRNRIRNLKHGLELSVKVKERMVSLQLELQQSQSLNTELCGKNRALEIRLSTLQDTNKELIQKLQDKESTVEFLSHHNKVLQARNAHAAMSASMTSRHETELVVAREKMNSCKIILEKKEEELVAVKQQLACQNLELKLAYESNAATFRLLNRNLETSRQLPLQDVNITRVQLQQAVASKKVSEVQCQILQKEVKALKEQMNKRESSTSSSSASKYAHSDSIPDPVIMSSLNWVSPQTVARQNETPASSKLTDALMSELHSYMSENKQQRLKLAEKDQQVKGLQGQLEKSCSSVASLEKTCSDQKMRLQELDLLRKPGSDVGAAETRLQREIEDLKRNKHVLLQDIEMYRQLLHNKCNSVNTLASINSDITHRMSQMITDFDIEKVKIQKDSQLSLDSLKKQLMYTQKKLDVMTSILEMCRHYSRVQRE